jgi:peptidoglycan hydrolase-like protein with peptidoglycan-binding domain
MFVLCTAGRVPGIAIGLCLAATAIVAAPQTTAKKSTAAATKSTKPVSAKAVASKSSKTRKAVNQAPPRPVQPSADRYREIQAALAEKGYLKSPPSGVWDQESTDAMRRFQEDQKIEATGKLTSRALISLGLGPKNEGQMATPAQVPQPVPPPPSK